jgi:xanthine dehydrogenase accessory factor
MRDRLQVARGLEELIQQGALGVLATLVAVEGSYYRRPGARALFTRGPQGSLDITAGIISGGCLEQDLKKAAESVLECGSPTLFYADLTAPGELLLGYGTGCPGKVKILLEPVGQVPSLPRLGTHASQPPAVLAAYQPHPALGKIGIVYESDHRDHPIGLRILDPEGIATYESVKIFWETPLRPPWVHLFGAGPDGRAATEILLSQGFPVHVYDHRPHWADDRSFRQNLAFRGPCHLKVSLWTDLDCAGPEGWGMDSQSLVILMTHHFLKDLEILSKIHSVAPCYIGILGSRRRAADLREACDNQKIPCDWSKVHGPIGRTPYPCDDPWQIGLAIAGEILQLISLKEDSHHV